MLAHSRSMLCRRTPMFASQAKSSRTMSSKSTLMTNSEAFVETLVDRGCTNTFGIVGSAFMDPLDLFPCAGIRFVSVAHEQNAVHMADGYSRVSNEPGVCISQNGPGITNFVTGVAAAYWAHSPVVVITPEAGTLTKGHGGFQECDQMPIFRTITKDQFHVNNPARMAELTGRAFDTAQNERGPVQLNIPRDFFYGENNFKIPRKQVVSRSAGSDSTLNAAAELIAKAKNPVILSGGGVVMGGAVPNVAKLAEFLHAPVASSYLHNDSFPANHELACGPIGYLGSQAAMYALKEADVVIALGSRLGPFGTLPQYYMNYWPENAKVIQVDIDHKRLGLTKEVDVAINGDAALAADAILARLQGLNVASAATKAERGAKIQQLKLAWSEELEKMTYGDPKPPEGKIKPRTALRKLQEAMPEDAMVATDIGNTCSVSNGYLNFNQPRSFLAAMSFGNCGYAFPCAMGAKVARPDRPAVAYVGEGAWGMSLPEVMTCVREKIPTTAVVFNNGQWGAEKKNQVLWFGDRYIGTQLENPSFAEIARAMGAEGVTINQPDQVGDALTTALKNQSEGKTTVIEIMTSRELGDPFRRDAMKLPLRRLEKYKSTDRLEESATQQPVDLHD